MMMMMTMMMMIDISQPTNHFGAASVLETPARLGEEGAREASHSAGVE
jgi:hypothetical protein